MAFVHRKVPNGAKRAGGRQATSLPIRSVRFARYSAQELAAASESLLFGTVGDIDQRIPGNWATRRWRRNKSAGTSSATTKAAPSWQAGVDTKVAPWKCPSRSAGLDPIVAEIIEAHAGT